MPKDNPEKNGKGGKKPSRQRSTFNGVSIYRRPDKVVDADTGRTMLIDAILKNDKAKVERLLESGAKTYKADKKGITPLHWAAQFGFTDIMALLLSKGAPLNDKDKAGKTALHASLTGPGALGTVKLLLDAGADPDIADNDGRIPLHVAVEVCGDDIAGLLARRTQNPGHADKKGITPLHEACRSGGVGAVKEILARRVPVTAFSHEGFTALHYATGRQDSSVALHLLTTEAAKLVNARDLNDCTPLQKAVERSDPELVAAMLRAGADPNVVDLRGYSPLHQAVHNAHADIAVMLIESGADVGNSVRGASTSPLVVAVAAGRQDMVRLLLDHNANPNEIGADDTMPLLAALHGSTTDILKMLLQGGADPNIANKRSVYPLHMACLFNQESAVRLLLAHKANPNLQDSEGQTPLHMFLRRDSLNLSIPFFLLQAGADPLVADNRGFCSYDRAHAQDRKALVDMFKSVLGKKGVRYDPRKPPNPPFMGYGI